MSIIIYNVLLIIEMGNSKTYSTLAVKKGLFGLGVAEGMAGGGFRYFVRPISSELLYSNNINA
jgi:hypothetical protein